MADPNSPADIEESLGGWSGMLRHPLRTLWNLRQRVAAAQEEIATLRARLAEAAEIMGDFIEADEAETIAGEEDAFERGLERARAFLALQEVLHG